MSHDPTTLYMGSHQSNILEAISYDCSPATFPAGTVGHLKSDGTVSLTASDGSKIGVSLGRSLSDINRVSFAVRGLKVPLLLDPDETPAIGEQVAISATTGKGENGATAVNALFRSEIMSAVDEDGVAITDGAALIDFPGGF